MSENVKQPSWYLGDKKFEVIRVIYDWNLGFSTGNAVKYIARAGIKNPAKEIEDLEKACYYLELEIAHLKEKKSLALSGWIPGDQTLVRTFDPKDVISDWKLNFNRGNAIMCIARAGVNGDEIMNFQEAHDSVVHEIAKIKELKNLELPLGVIKTVHST